MSEKYFETNVYVSGEFRIAAINPFSIFCIKTKTFESKKGTMKQDTLMSIQTTEATLAAVKQYRKVGDQIIIFNGVLDGTHVDDNGNIYIDVYAPMISFGSESMKNQGERLSMRVSRNTEDGLTLNQKKQEETVDYKALIKLLQEANRG